jgi:hypothetical protein
MQSGYELIRYAYVRQAAAKLDESTKKEAPRTEKGRLCQFARREHPSIPDGRKQHHVDAFFLAGEDVADRMAIVM